MEKGKAITVTPNKIQRLIHIAENREDNSYIHQDDSRRVRISQHLGMHCESSSGLLDLDNIETLEAMTDSDSANNFLTESTSFNPGEMTGRSTGADEISARFMSMGRHSVAVHALESEMDVQTSEVKDLLRHSISNTTTYSFQSKRDLTADEASLMMREAPLPVPASALTQFPDSYGTNSSALSVGAYFQKRCSGFEAVLGKTDSPDKSLYSMPSISEVPPKMNYIDETLDSIPVRQPRQPPGKLYLNHSAAPKVNENNTFRSTREKADRNYLTNKTFNPISGPNYSSISNVPEHQPRTLIPVASSSFASTRQPHSSHPVTETFVKTLEDGLKLTTEETGESACPTDNSISISKIADFLGKESSVNLSAMMQLHTRSRRKAIPKKQPLSELHLNYQENKTCGTQVTSLSESRKLDTASSAGTMTTVISADIQKESQSLPSISVSNSLTQQVEVSKDTRRSTRSKSPSSKSQTTLSTVHENCSSFKSGDSPIQTSKGEINNTHVPSPNKEYRELDKSVDWHDVLEQKRNKQQSLAKEQWAEIVASPCNGFVGVSCPVNCTITSLTDSWLTAQLKFHVPIHSEDLIIEPPRLPLISPEKTENFTFFVTSNIELDTSISYTMYLKDASIEQQIEQRGSFQVHIKMPVIQAMSCDEINKLTFPPIQETCSLFKSFVLVSDCASDLQLDISIVKADKIFSIKSVQEISKADVNKALMERNMSVEEVQITKGKSKGKKKQFCKLSNGNALRVTVNFDAPRLNELETEESTLMLSGALNVNLIGVNTVLRKVDLIGSVGRVRLVMTIPEEPFHLTNEPVNVTLRNLGSVTGVWIAKITDSSNENMYFRASPNKFDLRPGASKDVTLRYVGPDDSENTATLVFEDLITYDRTVVQMSGGSNAPKSFPIKTNHGTLSFVRPGKMEINLKNSIDKKVQVKVIIKGEGFSLELPGMEARGHYYLLFEPSECRTISVLFEPKSNMPYAAYLHLSLDKNSDLSRKVRLFGSLGGAALGWAGLVTYNELALVRAASRKPIVFELFNKGAAPVFLAAEVHFNLQYNAVEATARLLGNHRVVSGRTRHSLALEVDWSRVERCARKADTGVLATLAVLAGTEFVRKRILKVIRNESTGVLDTSLLADRLKVLAGQFEGEDTNVDEMLTEFIEPKAALTELIGGLQQLSAQVVLSQDYENTIVINDETVIEHHTLCD